MAAGKLFLAAMAALGVGAAPAPGTEDRGLRLEWREAGDKVSFRVVTSGARVLRLRYVLTVAGSSRSQNSGNVTVRPGEPAVVANVQVSPSQGWQAVLDVSGDQTYRIEAGQ